jgi:hypothetical protein
MTRRAGKGGAATQVGIGGMTRDEKTEEEMLTGETETAMGTARAQKTLQTRSETLISRDINKQIMRTSARTSPSQLQAQGASELCTLTKARVAECNHVNDDMNKQAMDGRPFRRLLQSIDLDKSSAAIL